MADPQASYGLQSPEGRAEMSEALEFVYAALDCPLES
jgi:hypothetical protein